MEKPGDGPSPAPLSSDLRRTRKFLCSYFHDGGWWSLMIDAYDMADAERRVGKLGNLRLDGEHVITVPVPEAAHIFFVLTWIFAVALIICSFSDGPFLARVILGLLVLASITAHKFVKV